MATRGNEIPRLRDSTMDSITWNQFSGTVRQAANAFVALGVEEQENIGIFSQNKPEWFLCRFRSFANRGVLFRSMERVRPHGLNTLSTMRSNDIFCWRTVQHDSRIQHLRLLLFVTTTDYFRPFGSKGPA